MGKVEDAAAEFAVELAAGGTKGAIGTGTDEVGDGFGLGEIEFAVDEGGTGEFSRFGSTTAAGKEVVENALDEEGIAVAGDFEEVFAGVGGRGREAGEDYLVESFASEGVIGAEGGDSGSGGESGVRPRMAAARVGTSGPLARGARGRIRREEWRGPRWFRRRAWKEEYLNRRAQRKQRGLRDRWNRFDDFGVRWHDSAMATYVYETVPQKAGDPVRRFEVQQSMRDDPLTKDPETGLPVKRVILGGYGIMTKGAAAGSCGEGRAKCPRRRAMRAAARCAAGIKPEPGPYGLIGRGLGDEVGRVQVLPVNIEKDIGPIRDADGNDVRILLFEKFDVGIGFADDGGEVLNRATGFDEGLLADGVNVVGLHILIGRGGEGDDVVANLRAHVGHVTPTRHSEAG